jgi:hypothetical protein
MGRYLEAGLLEWLWAELQHRASLRGGGRFGEAAGDMFFAFSLSHLMPSFVVLIVGTVLSSLLFIAELILNCLCKRKKNLFARWESENVVIVLWVTLQMEINVTFSCHIARVLAYNILCMYVCMKCMYV